MTVSLDRANKLFGDIELLISSLKQANEAFAKKMALLYSGGKEIKFEDLVKANLFDSFFLSEGVAATRLPLKSSSLLFFCLFEPGTKLDRHFHDCYERITVLSGDLTETGKEAPIKNTILLPPFTWHELDTKKGAQILVEFYK